MVMGCLVMVYRQISTFISLTLCFVLISACSTQMATFETKEMSLTTILAGHNSSFALDTDGTLWAWGADWSGQTDDWNWNVTAQPIPTRIMDNVAYFTSTGSYTAVLKADGSLWAWGIYVYLSGNYVRISVKQEPTKMMEDVYMVSTGGATFAIKTDNSLWAWGDNRLGQLGDGTATVRHEPIKIMDDVIYVSAGMDHTMAIRADGSLWAWGGGVLGIGTTEGSNYPIKIMEDVVAVSAGLFHTAAIRIDGSLWVWGANLQGQIGDGTTECQLNPKRIMEDVIAVSVGGVARYGYFGGHTMAIRSDGSLWAWGGEMSNENFHDGVEPPESALRPARIKEDVTAISVGNSHFMAMTSDGALWTWGWNEYGQLGDGTTISRDYPVKIMSGVSIP